MDDDDLLRATPPPKSIRDTLSSAASQRTSSSTTLTTPNQPGCSRNGTPGTPKLGDFSRLQAAALSSRSRKRQSPPPTISEDGSGSFPVEVLPDSPSIRKHQDASAVTLGNFFKLFNQLGLSESPSGLEEGSSHTNTGAAKITTFNIVDGRTSAKSLLARRAVSPKAHGLTIKSSRDLNSDSESLNDSDFDNASYATLLTTPPSSVEREYHALSGSTSRLPLPESSRTKPFGSFMESIYSAEPQPSVVFSYQNVKYGPVLSVLGYRREEEQKHETLSTRLISQRAIDEMLKSEFPTVVSNGAHVFVDMSNINISFHVTLRRKYNLPDDARFKPLPNLNLQFLTEILLRGRDHRVLNVGCSIQPGRREPQYVRHLHKLGYRVDLRERKRMEEMTHDRWVACSSSSDELCTPKSVRYVEDLVDETLQTRIGESVMEYFNEQGTLVIATGDAKPAKYSDGFFTYADRALRMGWNVEVVSWRCSLSSTWRNPAWADQWGSRFRVIELDDYLDDLLI